MRRSTFRLLALPAVLAVVAAAALAGPVLASGGKPTASVVAVTGTEFKFKLLPGTVKAGAVTFRFTNRGKLPHDFKIGGKKTPLVAPGKSASLTVVLKKGKAAYLCTVPGHAAGGMKGLLTVT